MQIGPTRLRPAVAALAGVLATTVVLGACGSDEDGGPAASEADVTVLAEDSLQFDQTSYSATPPTRCSSRVSTASSSR
jgi:hypothetical protein